MRNFVTVLLEKRPEMTIKALRTEQFSDIRFDRVVHSLQEVKRNYSDVVLEYLSEHCIRLKHTTVKSVHNL